MPDEKQQLATIAAVLDDTDRLLDKLFANVADLKAIILARTPPGPPDKKADAQ